MTCSFCWWDEKGYHILWLFAITDNGPTTPHQCVLMVSYFDIMPIVLVQSRWCVCVWSLHWGFNCMSLTCMPPSAVMCSICDWLMTIAKWQLKISHGAPSLVDHAASYFADNTKIFPVTLRRVTVSSNCICAFHYSGTSATNCHGKIWRFLNHGSSRNRVVAIEPTSRWNGTRNSRQQLTMLIGRTVVLPVECGIRCTGSARGEYSAALSVLKDNLVAGIYTCFLSVSVTTRRTNSVIMSRSCRLTLSHVGHMLELYTYSRVVNTELVRFRNT